MSEDAKKSEKPEITKQEYLDKCLDLAMAGFFESEIHKILSVYRVKD